MPRAVRFVLMMTACTLTAAAENGSAILPGVSLTPGKGSGTLSAPLQIVILLTLLTLLPAIIMSVTPFLRISIVLHFLRQALGTQSTPSNQVLIGLALFLTLLIMNPVISEIYTKAWEPMEKGQINQSQALKEGSKPLWTFLLSF